MLNSFSFWTFCLRKFRSIVAGSPILLNNIFGCDLFSDSPSLYISPSPFGASQPTMPVARVITVARIASPFSINKRHQSIFLKALKAYFESGRKLMKPSDVFAVSVNTDDSRRSLEPKLEEDLLGLRFFSSCTFLLLTKCELSATSLALTDPTKRYFSK